MVFAMVANGDTVVLQNGFNGYEGGMDTHTASHSANRVCGQDAGNGIGLNSSITLLGLLKWDVSSLAGATITGATMSIYGFQTGNPEEQVDAHAILPANSAWVEGFPGSTGATWNYLNNAGGVPWASGAGTGCSVPGVDYDPAVLDSWAWVDGSAPATGDVMFKATNGAHFDLGAALVQSWVDDVGDNAGVLLKHPDIKQNHAYYADEAVEDATWPIAPQYVPRLTIEYIPEPVTMVLLGLGGLFIRRRK